MYTFFKGLWRLHRSISDGSVMEGEAVFTVIDETQLHYTEQGLFHSLAASTEFYQEYIYSFEEEGAFSIHFAKNATLTGLFMRFTHHLSDSHHQCKQDHYRGRFDITSPNSFSLIYDVKGPRKDYSMTTIYTRK